MKEKLAKYYIHGNNIIGKYNQKVSPTTKRLLSRYLLWKEMNEKITEINKAAITKKAALFEDYLKQVKKETEFSSQSKLASTVLEEFIYYLFKDLIRGYKLSKTELGGTTAYSNLYFCPPNIVEFQRKSFININEKDQDFAIYRPIEIKSGSEIIDLNVPMVSIECKTYLDKTMLEGSIATAEKIKLGNPYCLFVVVTETYAVDVKSVDPKYSRIDQIYVLRRQKASSMKVKPICNDVVWRLFERVKQHLEADWSAVEKKITQKGIAL